MERFIRVTVCCLVFCIAAIMPGCSREEASKKAPDSKAVQKTEASKAPAVNVHGIPTEWPAIHMEDENVDPIMVNVDGTTSYQYITEEGDTAFEFDPHWQRPRAFSEGLAYVRYVNENTGEDYPMFIRPDGTKAFSLDRHFEADDFSGGRVAVYDKDKDKDSLKNVEYLDPQGGSKFTLRIIEPHRFSDGLLYAFLPEKKGAAFYSAKGVRMFDAPKDMMFREREFSEGMLPYWAALRRNEKGEYIFSKKKSLRGYINNRGERAIAPAFVGALPFGEGLGPVATVKDGNKLYGYINKNGEWVIEPQFKYAYTFNNGVAVISTAEMKYGVIDHEGNFVIEPVYDYLGTFHHGMASYKIDGGTRHGLINLKGEIVMEPYFDTTPAYRNGYWEAYRNSVRHIINRHGRIIWPRLTT